MMMTMMMTMMMMLPVDSLSEKMKNHNQLIVALRTSMIAMIVTQRQLTARCRH